MIFLELFITFFKIGLFSFGGGYAMLSLIQDEVVVSHNWMTHEEFANLIAISQMTPGPISINCSTYIGYTATDSIFGAAISTLALCTPSFILMALAAFFFFKLKDNAYIKTCMRALRPVVVALILSAVFVLCNKENFIDYYSYVICAVSFILVYKKVNPIYVILLAGFTGYLIY